MTTNTKSQFKTYPQIDRVFTLQKISVERCKNEFADCYHHKHQLAKESAELALRLKKGIELIQWLKTTGATLTAEQNKDYKYFRNGANYLIRQLEELATHIQQVDEDDFTPTPYNPYKTQLETHNEDLSESNAMNRENQNKRLESELEGK